MTDLSTYKVTFRADGIGAVSVLQDETPAQISSGYGGWTVTSRQRRIGLTMWQGKDPLRMSVPVIFDGYASQQGQEVPISRLSRMGLPPEGGGEPPIVSVKGLGIPDAGPVEWVIENIQWGTNVIWDNGPDGTMVRMRQDAVVNLIQYMHEDRVAFKSGPIVKSVATVTKQSTPTHQAVKKGLQKPYVVKAGDTLIGIANRVYKNAKPDDWKRIARANNIRDPRSLQVGARLRIPKK